MILTSAQQSFMTNVFFSVYLWVHVHLFTIYELQQLGDLFRYPDMRNMNPKCRNR